MVINCFCQHNAESMGVFSLLQKGAHHSQNCRSILYIVIFARLTNPYLISPNPGWLGRRLFASWFVSNTLFSTWDLCASIESYTHFLQAMFLKR